MAEATYLKDPSVVEITAPAALVNGQVLQIPDGRAGLFAGAGAGAASGDLVSVQVLGHARVAKNIIMVILNGQEIWWDISENEATHSAILGDFKIGVAVAAASSTAATVDVDLNVALRPVWELFRDKLTTEATDGLGTTKLDHNAPVMAFDTATEVAQAALYSLETIPVARKPIFEGILNITDNGDNAALDISFGLANGSHGTDFDSVTESAIFHFNGTDLKIYAESDDGSTEVNATDTTIVYVVGTAVFYQIDCTNLADIQMYVNGVLVLPASVFKLDAATGPLLAICHMEKTSDDTSAEMKPISMHIRTAIDT